MKNKQAKQMIVDITLKGRKCFWFGEDSEMYAAKSLQQLIDIYGDPDPDFPEDEKGGLVSSNYKVWWKPILVVKGDGYCKGAKVKDKYGKVSEIYETSPLISGVFGNEDQDCPVSTSYS